MSEVDDLLLVKMSLVAIRRRVNEELDALEIQVSRLIPAEEPKRPLPTNIQSRKQFYKERLNKL